MESSSSLSTQLKGLLLTSSSPAFSWVLPPHPCWGLSQSSLLPSAFQNEKWATAWIIGWLGLSPPALLAERITDRGSKLWYEGRHYRPLKQIWKKPPLGHNFCRKAISHRIKDTDARVRLPGSSSQLCHLSSLWPGEICITSLSDSFFVKMNYLHSVTSELCYLFLVWVYFWAFNQTVGIWGPVNLYFLWTRQDPLFMVWVVGFRFMPLN